LAFLQLFLINPDATVSDFLGGKGKKKVLLEFSNFFCPNKLAIGNNINSKNIFVNLISAS
jgi:hypothetical protein